MAGGVAQAYATMGFCTCMKTVEITKHKMAAQGVKPPGTFETFMDIYRKEGIRGINRGVNAVAIRQTTNWGSRFGLSRLAESAIRKTTGKEEGQKLSGFEKILASSLGGVLSATLTFVNVSNDNDDDIARRSIHCVFAELPNLL